MEPFSNQSNHNHTNLNHKILVEQIKLLYQSLLPVIALNFLVSSGLAITLWGDSSTITLSIWMSLMLFALTLRGLTFVFYCSHFTPQKAQSFAHYFVMGTTAVAIVWGFGCLLLFIDLSLKHQLLVMFVLAAMASGSLSALSIYLPAFYSFFLITLLPITTYLIFIDTKIHLTLGIMTMFYIVALSFFVIKINNSHKLSLKLRFENLELVAQLRQQKNEADRANLAKSKFLSAASHDLRQPLYALSLFTSVLDESTQPPKMRRVIEQINASVDSLQGLFNALLDISQLDAGVTKIEKIDFSITPLLIKLANDFDTLAHEKGLALNWPENTVNLHSDPALLEQILRNYLSNAIRYTQTGSITVSFDTDEDSNEDTATICVSDSGIGICATDQQSIFEEFHQLTNPERDREKGLGLGLAIVKRTATLLDHAISVKSEPAQGSTFSVTVEKAHAANVAATVKAMVAEAETPFKQDVQLFILVVDDEASVREGTQKLLQAWGYEVLVAADKDEALVQVSKHGRAPDGIIADYRLPHNQTGIDTIKDVYEKYQKVIPALIVTGDIAVELLKEINDNGFQVLHKPVAAVKLRTFLRYVERQQRSL